MSGPRTTAIPPRNATTTVPIPTTAAALNTNHQATTTPSPLAARVAQKRTELSSLLQLRDLSAQLASQMSELETKLSTLSDGTEAVAEVLANWGRVLGAIRMAAGGVGELPETLVRVAVDDVVDARRETGEE